MYRSDPRPDTVSLMQLESRRAVPQGLQPPSKASARTFNRPRSEKPLQTSGSRTFFSFSCFSMADKEAVSRSVALLLRIKALALQKRPLFVLFALVGRTLRHIGCRNIMRSRGCAVQNKGITLNRMVCCSQFSNDIYALISL